jgi:hypothetical protein
LVRLTPNSTAIRIAFWCAVLFVVAAPLVAVLGAIPYGGGGVPNEVKSIFAVTQIIGVFVIYAGLLRGAA